MRVKIYRTTIESECGLWDGRISHPYDIKITNKLPITESGEPHALLQQCSIRGDRWQMHYDLQDTITLFNTE